VGSLSPPHLPQRPLLLVGEVGPDAGYVGEPTEIRPTRIAKLKSPYVEGGSVLAPVTGFLASAGDRMVGRPVTVCASDRAAVRFYGRGGLRPKGVTLEVPL
jgi:hypothetical protein